MGGPEPPGTAQRDQLVLFGSKLLDINGNVGELARDVFASESSDCLQSPILSDPDCGTGSSTTVVAGGWLSSLTGLRGDSRVAGTDADRLPGVGFRCAYDDP